jgi:SAM-dependent methyltransferase
LVMQWQALERLLRWALLLAALVYALKQVRKPSRWGGRLFVWVMNLTHSGLTDWGLNHVRIEKHFTILDVGCGGGRTIQKLAALAADGTVYGVDYAEGSVAASRAKNAQLIKAGRAEVRQASVSQLPFPNDMFDLVTAVETQYYWPDLVKDMQEILRVLKPGGQLIVIAESYKKGAYNKLQAPVLKLIKAWNLGVEDHRRLFSTAGYIDIQIFEETRKGWLCGIGEKP